MIHEDPFKSMVTFDDALYLVGGFGRFQYFSTLVLVWIFEVGFYLLYGYSLLTNYPVYQAKVNGEWADVDREVICATYKAKGQPDTFGTDWRIDYSNPASLYNWVDPDKLDLTCESAETIGLAGSGYFIGFAISAFFLPQLADKVGRKRPVLIG